MFLAATTCMESDDAMQELDVMSHLTPDHPCEKETASGLNPGA